MNRFLHHHRDSILFSYSCFDRMILKGCVVPFMHTERAGTIRWFLRTHRQIEPSRASFAKIASDYHGWVEDYAGTNGIEIVVPEKDVKREELVEPYFKQLGGLTGNAVILRAREPERVAWHYSKSNTIGVGRRFVDLYYFYLNDPQCGRMSLRICPYFPCNISIWINGHNWLARQLQKENIGFKMCDNLFVACEQPQRLQQLSDTFAPADIISSVETWLDRLLPFFSPAERHEGYRHQLYMAQIEYCNNLIFKKQACLHRLFDRFMDANRGLGHPDKLAIIFGRSNVHPQTCPGQTTIRSTKTLRLPVLTGSFKQTDMKQYVKEGIAPVAALRTESSCFQLNDLSIGKNIDNLPNARKVMDTANQRCLQVEQDILATFVDRGQLQKLRQPSTSDTGRRIPGIRVDDPRLLAVLNAILCFAYFAAGKGGFRTRDLLLDVQNHLREPEYTLAKLRYDLGKLRGKGLVFRRPQSQTYELTDEGYRIAIFYLKLYQQMYAPLTAGILEPIRADNEVLSNRRTKLDRLYAAVDKALKQLADQLSLAA